IAIRNRGTARAPVSDCTAVSMPTLAAEALSLIGELNYQNQERDHAADESNRPDELLRECLILGDGIVGVEWFRFHPASDRRSVEPRDDVPGDEGQDGQDDDDDRAVLDRCVSGETRRLGFRTVRVFVAHGSSLTALRGRHAFTRQVRTTTLQDSKWGE